MSRSLRNITVSASSFPNQLVPKVRTTKHGVQEQFQIVAGGGVAVEVDAAGVLEYPVKLDHTLGHHGEVGHHVVAGFANAEKGAHGLEEV